MNCSNCGRETSGQERICSHCGWSLGVMADSDDQDTRFDLAPKAVLGNRFELLHKIGSGGMGEVWLANDRDLREQVAIKLLREDLACDEPAMHAIADEVKIARRLTHPNILRIHELHQHGDRPFISMEYIDGQSLQAIRIREGGRLTLDRLIPLARQIAAALDYAHSAGVLHRDVKPANILIDKRGKASLADFGIARIAHDANTRLTGRPSSGTLAYMSLEQLDNDKSARNDPRSDVYSFAVSLYELLSGEPPFSGGDIVGQIRSKPPDPIGGIPPHVNAAILKSLSKDRTLRHPSCLALLDDIESPPPPPPNGCRKRFWRAAAAVLVLLVVGGAIVGAFRLLATSPGTEPLPVSPTKPTPEPQPQPAPEPQPVPPTPPTPEPQLKPMPEPQTVVQTPSAPQPRPVPSTQPPSDGETPFEIDFGFYRQDGRRMSDGSVLRSGEQFWIEFKANIDCYVYVFNYAPSGKIITLYPRTDIKTEPRVAKGKLVLLPNDEYSYQADNKTGEEKIVLVASIAPLTDIELIAKRIQKKVSEPDRKKLDAAIRTRDVGIASKIVPAPAAPSAAARPKYEIEKLQGKGSLVHTINFLHK